MFKFNKQNLILLKKILSFQNKNKIFIFRIKSLKYQSIIYFQLFQTSENHFSTTLYSIETKKTSFCAQKLSQQNEVFQFENLSFFIHGIITFMQK